MFKKPKQVNIVSSAVGIGGAIAGGMVSRVVVNAIATDTSTTEGKNKKLYASLGIAVLSIVAAASVTGDDSTTTAVKGAFTGMAVEQGLSAISQFATNQDAKSGITAPQARVALGLGCACNDAPKTNCSYQGMPVPMLQYPSSDALLERYSNNITKDISFSGIKSI